MENTAVPVLRYDVMKQQIFVCDK